MEDFAAAFKHKGRLREGFDADITGFDLEEITDMGTFQQPLRTSKNIQYVPIPAPIYSSS